MKFKVINIIGDDEISSLDFDEWCKKNKGSKFMKNATKTIYDCKLLEKIA